MSTSGFRGSAPLSMRARTVAVAKALVALLMSAAFFGVAVHVRALRAASRTAEVKPLRESELTQRLYEGLDNNTLTRAEVLSALENPDEAVRLAAVRGYAMRLGTYDPMPLVARLNDTQERVRLAALQGIGALGNPRAVSALADVLASRRSASERGLALEMLMSIPDESCVPPVIEALADGVASIRVRAFSALSKRLGTDLGFTAAELDKESQPVREAFRMYWKETRQ